MCCSKLDSNICYTTCYTKTYKVCRHDGIGPQNIKDLYYLCTYVRLCLCVRVRDNPQNNEASRLKVSIVRSVESPTGCDGSRAVLTMVNPVCKWAF